MINGLQSQQDYFMKIAVLHWIVLVNYAVDSAVVAVH